MKLFANSPIDYYEQVAVIKKKINQSLIAQIS